MTNMKRVMSMDSSSKYIHQQLGLREGSIIVLKIGTSSLIKDKQETLNISALANICQVVRELHDQGNKVVLVSSGAVGVGCQELGITQRPSELSKKQALAAVGQVQLMRKYSENFKDLGMHCSQVLFTLDNWSSRQQNLNARNCFIELLEYGVVPIVNENDTVAVEQLRIGDNDTLSAQVATLIGADWLFLLTDVDCLYTSNPNTNPDAQPIHEVRDVADLQVDTSTKGTQWGSGGMVTKITAARMACAAGCRTVVCSSRDLSTISRIMKGEKKGTVFYPTDSNPKGKKRWILSIPSLGEVWLDDGAVAAVADKHRSLFAAGIIHVKGQFGHLDVIDICDKDGQIFAKAFSNFSSQDILLMKGRRSKDFPDKVASPLDCQEVCHRDNIVIVSALSTNGNSPNDSEIEEST
eukprot:TRINITY_DN4341_c0_g1_i1.p1 TRINITY_DN4341_c0_g1~~TRINITY_DN4341_c0_g1_i1.p1  ORF type:complete len:410 (+),score=46.70 TRINITY_DN4341_c0_g1_i1:161-1390(+)